MISLNIPYIKEEEYQKRMADYIDEITFSKEVLSASLELILEI